MVERLANMDVPVWLVNDHGNVEVLTLAELVDNNNRGRIEGKTVLLPTSAGALNGSGMLDGSEAPESAVLDVADTADRVRVWVGDGHFDEKTRGLHAVPTITFNHEDEDAEENWVWVLPCNEDDETAPKPVLWEVHVRGVVRHAQMIVDKLALDDRLKQAIVAAARWHDHGKKRQHF